MNDLSLQNMLKMTRNDALEEAAKLAEMSINDGGLAKSMAHFVNYSDWVTYKETCLKYSAMIRSMKDEG